MSAMHHDPSAARHPTRRRFLAATSTLAGAFACRAFVPRAGAQPPASGDPIVIRGHHLFDMLDAIGTGVSNHKTLGPIALRVRARPDARLKIVVGADAICAPCEWWDHEKGLCKKGITTHPRDNENAIASDRNAIRTLGLEEGEERRADELYRLIRARVDKRVFAEEVCVACRLVDRCKETYERKIQAAVDALSPGRP